MERTTISTSGAPSRTIGIEAHAHEREQILQIFLEQQARGVEIRPPRIVFYFRRDHRKGNQRHIGKLMRELGHGARLTPLYSKFFTCCIDLDRSALNTFGNALETKRWAREHNFNSLIVVTSNWHMPRAQRLVSSALPK